MDAKYTPGPWAWAEGYQGLYGSGPNNTVLEYYSYEGLWLDDSAGNQEANARLIAAAPDLLEALKLAESRLTDFAEYLSKSGKVYWLGELETISAAIAKAEGET
jgi:hypothetical protein